MTAVIGILKNSTRHLHNELEQVSFAHEIMSKQLNAQQYHELLCKNDYIYEQLEPQLNDALAKIGKLFPQLFYSSRCQDLKMDLTYFSQKKEKISSEHKFILEEKNAMAWLGVLYVLEGSRLGGNVIVKALKNNPHLKSIPEFHFYQQHNIDIRSRWIAFQKILSQDVLSDEDIQVTINAANQTFNYFHKIHQLSLS